MPVCFYEIYVFFKSLFRLLQGRAKERAPHAQKGACTPQAAAAAGRAFWRALLRAPACTRPFARAVLRYALFCACLRL